MHEIVYNERIEKEKIGKSVNTFTYNEYIILE